MKIKIMLADDHHIVRQGLRALLAEYEDLEVIGEAEDGFKAVRLARDIKPDVIIMDIKMPGMSGIEATREIIAENPQMKIIALSMHSERQFISKMLEVGASGYLLKDCAFEELVTAIRNAVAGQTYLSGRLENPAEPC